MKTIKTITVLLSEEMGKDMLRIAKAEGRTINEIIGESFRQYKVQNNFAALVKKGTATAKKKKLTPKDFGGPFKE